MLRNPAINFANFAGHDTVTIENTGALFNPCGYQLGRHRRELRARWPGRLIVKGPLGPEDARLAVSVGADGVQLSNHGGRQLDRSVPPVHTIAAVREALGPDVSVLVDSGVRHGSDIAVALALGADACAIGRAYLYGLMAGGEAGVNRALDILAEQFKRTMQLLGVRSVAQSRRESRALAAGVPVNGPRRPATGRRSSALVAPFAQRQVDRAGVPRHGFDLGDVVLVGRGAGQHVQVRAAEIGERGGVLPVPVGGIGLADLGHVALQRRDAADHTVLSRLRGLHVAA